MGSPILPPLAEEQLLKRAAQAWRSLLLGSDEDKAFTKEIHSRHALHESGLEDTDPTSFMGPNPEVLMAGMTKYLTSAGKPDRLARMIGTETFKNKLGQMGLGEIGERFASRYPRISAHMNPMRLTDSKAFGKTAIGDTIGRYNPAVKVGLNTADNPNVERTLAHEATHVAQRLGLGSRMPHLYEEANKDFGYYMNPFEQSANNAAQRYVGGRSIPPKTLSNITETVITPNGQAYESPMINYIKSFFGK